jgi:mRNA interferase MazF
VKTGYFPRRGDIVWLSFSPQVGHEQAGHRPGVVVSPGSYNRLTGLALICPVSSKSKGYSFETPLPAASPVQGVVLSDHVRNMDWRSRKARKGGRVPAPVLMDILRKLATLLDQDAA